MNYLSIIALFIFCLNLNALTIKLNSAKEKNSYYSILHIDAKSPIECSKKVISLDRSKFECVINKRSEVALKPKKSRFVDIYISSKDDKSIITLYPKAAVKVYKFDKPLYKRLILDDIVLSRSKHWIFIFFKRDTILKSQKQKGINFPVEFSKEPAPYIGALDPSGIPIDYINESKDINAYLSIKDDYDKGRYEFVIKEIDSAIKNYPHSIFLNEFYLYKIRSLMHILQNSDIDPNTADQDYSTIIKLGKKWAKIFSSDPNIPEVLYYIAISYQNLGQNSDAEYFFDILITEHPKSKWTKLGIIAFADNIFKLNKQKRALKLYKDVLYSTDDIKVASIAADRLAEYYINNKNLKKAEFYFDKILDANPDFFLKDHEKAYEKALALENAKLNKSAIKILKKLLPKLKREPDLKENVIKELADLYKKVGDKKSAMKYYNLYIKYFPYGQYIDSVKRDIDGMFFDTDEKNSTKLLKHYNNLIKKYKAGKIYQKAEVLKIELLIKLKRYKEALKEIDSFDANAENKKVVKKLETKAAMLLANNYLKESSCLKAIKIISDYNLSIKEDLEKLAKCYLDTFRYDDAIKIANKKVLDKNLDIQKRLFWMDLEANALLKISNYNKLLPISDDIITLSDGYNKEKYRKKGYYYKFFALFGLKKYKKALALAQKIEKLYRNNFENIEVFKKIIDYAKNIENNAMIINYSKKIISLQKRYNSFILSPEIELLLIKSLKAISRYQEAKKIAKELITRIDKRDNETKSRVLYELGDISLSLKDKNEAKKYFKECSKIKKTSWSSLCKESLSLY